MKIVRTCIDKWKRDEDKKKKKDACALCFFNCRHHSTSYSRNFTRLASILCNLHNYNFIGFRIHGFLTTGFEPTGKEQKNRTT